MFQFVKFSKDNHHAYIGCIFLLYALIELDIRYPSEIRRGNRFEVSSRISGFIEIDGVNLHYAIDGSGPDCYYFMQTMQTLSIELWVNQLKDRFRVIRIDILVMGLLKLIQAMIIPCKEPYFCSKNL